jgi:hypothetical protein
MDLFRSLFFDIAHDFFNFSDRVVKGPKLKGLAGDFFFPGPEFEFLALTGINGGDVARDAIGARDFQETVKKILLGMIFRGIRLLALKNPERRR